MRQRDRPSIIRALIVLVAAALLVGCGSPDPVTYTDPNPADMTLDGAGESPIESVGLTTWQQLLAVERLEARLDAAETLVARADSRAASTLLSGAADEDIPTIVAGLALRSADDALAVRDRWMPLTDAAAETVRPAELAAARTQLDAARTTLTPDEFREDVPLVRSIATALGEAASLAYEEQIQPPDDAGLTVGDAAVSAGREFSHALLERSVALLTPTMSTEATRGLTEAAAELSSTVFPAADPPVPDDDLSERVTTFADTLSEAAGIDTTPPSPTDDSRKRLDTAADAIDRYRAAIGGAGTDRAKQTAVWTQLTEDVTPALDDIATVDPTAAVTIAMALGIDLRPGSIGDPAALDAVESTLDAAADLVREELDLLAEDEASDDE